MNFREIFDTAEKFTVDNSPAILTAIGVTGSLTTAYLTGKASFRVGKDVNAGHYEPIMEGQEPEVYDFKRLVKTYWKEYIPPAASATITVTAIICANRVSTRRMAALAAAYTISEKSFGEYKEKIIERIGEKKEQAARDEIQQDRVRRNPPEEGQIIITGAGDVLCYDHFTGRYFKSDMETLKKAQNDTNYQILHHSYASLSDFYERVGLPATSMSEELGWRGDQKLELLFSATLSNDGRPCIAFDFDVSPIRNYHRCYGE